MITNQTLTLKILAADDFEIHVIAKSDGTTELKTTPGGTATVRTAMLIALGRKLQAVYPHVVNEIVE